MRRVREIPKLRGPSRTNRGCHERRDHRHQRRSAKQNQLRETELIHIIYAQGSPLALVAQARRTALNDERRRTHTTTAHIGEHAQVVAHPGDSRIPLATRSDSRQHLGIGKKTKSDEESFERSDGQTADESTERDGDNAEREGYAPFAATDTSHLEGSPTDKDNKNLNRNFCITRLVLYTRPLTEGTYQAM